MVGGKTTSTRGSAWQQWLPKQAILYVRMHHFRDERESERERVGGREGKGESYDGSHTRLRYTQHITSSYVKQTSKCSCACASCVLIPLQTTPRGVPCIHLVSIVRVLRAVTIDTVLRLRRLLAGS